MYFANFSGKNRFRVIDEYMLKTPNHSYFRNLTYEKFVLGFGAGYLILRELPIRNFYARCIIMSVAIAKMFDHVEAFMPGSAIRFRVVGA